MPGVPPDALAQVKRGLKGLFGRKKRQQAQAQGDSSTSQQQQQPTPSQTTSEAQNPTITTTAPSPSPGQGAEQKTRIDDGFPPPPPGPPPHSEGGSPLPSQAQQISEPAAVGEAKNIDLDPSSTTTAPASTSTAPTDTPATTTTKKSVPPINPAAATAPAAPQPTADPNGMSATSGPLDDSMGLGEYEPGKASIDDADGSKFLQKERDLENDMPVDEAGTAGEGSAIEQARKAGETTTTRA